MYRGTCSEFAVEINCESTSDLHIYDVTYTADSAVIMMDRIRHRIRNSAKFGVYIYNQSWS